MCNVSCLQAFAMLPQEFSPKARALYNSLVRFMDEHIYPNEARFEHEVESSQTWYALLLLVCFLLSCFFFAVRKRKYLLCIHVHAAGKCRR